MTKLYNSESVEKFINQYIDMGGYIAYSTEGCLLEYGICILQAEKLKSIVIQDVFINSWSSGYSVRKYDILPEKYQNLIDSI